MEQRYYEFAFKNGENFHIKEKDVDKLVNESGCKILTWEDYKPFAIKVKSEKFNYDLKDCRITIKEIN